MYIFPPCESWSQPAVTPRKRFGSAADSGRDVIIAEVAAPGVHESGWLPLDVTMKEEEEEEKEG